MVPVSEGCRQESHTYYPLPSAAGILGSFLFLFYEYLYCFLYIIRIRAQVGVKKSGVDRNGSEGKTEKG